MPRPSLVAVLALALLAPPSPARDADWPVDRAPAREPAAYRHDAKAVAALPRDYLDSAVAVILFAGCTHRLEPDGTVATTTHEVTRLNGRKAVERLGEFRGITYTPSYQRVTLHEARIHKASGKTVPVAPAHVHLRDVSTDYQVYDPEKQLIISFPGLEVGDVLEVRWTVRGKNPEHAGQLFQRYSFGDAEYPVAVDELRVTLPRERTLKHATVHGRAEQTMTEVNGERTYRWRTTHLPRPPRDENLPSREELRPTVVLSTFTDWSQVGRWKEALRRSCWQCTPDVRAVVDRVTTGLNTPAAKARALTYWVRRNIRYVSAGERHDYTPHPPAQVLANRFGDCKDTTQLLAVLLREAGVRVELATLGTRDDGQIHADVPSPWGTHAILLATIDGKPHWIDTTISLAAWDFLPRDDRDRLCYLTDEKGMLRLVRTPAATADDSRTDATTDVTVESDGRSRCRRTVVSHGAAAMAQRDLYLETPPGERRRLLTGELQDAISRTRLLALTIDEKALGDFDRPVTITSEFDIPGHFAGETELEGNVTDSRVWGKLLAFTFDHDRQTPLELPSAFVSTHVYRFHAPATHQVDGPPRDRTLRSPWGTFSVRSRFVDDGEKGRSLELTFHTRLDRTRVEITDLEAFRTFQDDVNRAYRVWVTLRPATDLAAAPRLEKVLNATPANRPVAAALARIYLQAGRLADARRVLDAARRHHPSAVDLLELRVRAADTPADEESALREFVKQQPDRTEARLDLASTLISRGKQDDARVLLEPLTKTGEPRTQARAHYQLARSHYRQDRLPAALEQLERAERADPVVADSLRFLVLRGQVLEELKRPADAITVYRKALERDRTSQDVLLSLVRLCLASGDELAALDYLRRFTLQVDRDVNGLLLAAETYLVMKRHDEAAELARRAREIGFHEKAQRILGLVALARHDYPAAVRHLQRADPDDVVLTGWIEAQLRAGQLGDLERTIDRARRVTTPSARLRQAVEKGQAALARKKKLRAAVRVEPGKEEAVTRAAEAVVCAELAVAEGLPADVVTTLLQPALAVDALRGPALAVRARLALERGQLTAALTDAERAIALGADGATAYLVRGRVRLERAQPAAVADLERAAALTGRKDAEVLAFLADALHLAGRTAEAVRTMKEATTLRPKDGALADKLRALEAAGSTKRAG